MAEESSKTYVFGQDGNNMLPYMYANNNGWNANGWGGGILGFLLGTLFSGGWGNGLWGNNHGANGYVANALNNDAGRDLIMQGIQGNANAINQLASSLNTDYASVQSALNAINSSINAVGSQVGMSGLQVINAIQAGNASLATQLQKSCCDNQLAICQQTNALQTGINNVGQQVVAKAAADQLAMCQQTYALTDTMNRNYLALDNKLDAMESSRKDRELAEKDAEIATLKSQNFLVSVVQQAIAPINAQMGSIYNEVEAIKGKMPNTVPVQYPNLTAVNTTPYTGGMYYGNNGFWGY